MSVISTCAKMACIDAYNPSIYEKIGTLYQTGDVVCGSSIEDNIVYIAIQGTENKAEVFSDLYIEPTYDPVLGYLHSGFLAGLDEIASKILQNIPLNSQVVCTGHSLGAARAAILSAKLKLSGVDVIKNVLFACPNPGYHQLYFWLSMNISGISFRNTPFDLPILGDPIPFLPAPPYHPPYWHTNICLPPKTFLKKFFQSCWHSADLYYAACSSM